MADRRGFLLYFLISFLLQCAPSLQDCPPPNVDSNVEVTPDQSYYSSYMYVQFSCPPGYSATNGSTYSYCYPSSYWYPDMSQVISCTVDTDVTTPATGNVSAKAMVFVADKSLSKIFMADFSSGDFESLTFTALPIGSVNQPLDVDYDPQTRMVYWSDMAGTIRRANIDGTMQSVILDSSVGRAEGIALDTGRGKIFWTDETYDRIMSANLDGSNAETLINTDISNPRAIVIHKNMGVMFWTDWSYPGRIERANLDGGDRYVIINSTVVWPNGLDLNSYGGRIYWCDASTDKIESADLWGDYRDVHLSTSSIHPYDLAFVNDYTLAWTDWNMDAIGLTTVYDNNYTLHYSDTFQNPYGIHVTPNTSCQGCCECGHMGGCFCDSVCQQVGDCCHDYVQFCNDYTPTPQPTGQWDTDNPESSTDSWWQPQTTPWWWWNTDGPESTTENRWQPQTTPWWWWNTDRPESTTENRWQPQTTPWWWWNTDRPTPDGPDYTTWMWGTSNPPFVGEENVTLEVGVTQTISSPNYPSNHPNNVRYNWYITAPPGYDVIVDFLDFKLESCCDFLRIGIGESPSSPGSVTLATLTGSSLPSDMRLYSSPSWMMFYTDTSVTYRGFQLRLSLTNENTAITTESPNTRWWWWTTTDYPAITTDSPNTRWWWWTTDYPGTTDSPLQPNETARLVNGSYSSEGRVEVYHSGTWGTVCDHSWDVVDAGVLCRSIGYPDAVRSHGNAFYGMGDGPILLNHVGCYGYEDSLFDCYHHGVGVHHCSHDEDAGAVCYPDARLVNGDDPSEGRLEVYYDGVWGTVCDHSWYSTNSYVVCRSLGFPGYIGHVYNAYFGQGTGPIHLNHVTCMGDEGSIFDCRHYGVGNNHCYHSEDIGIRCLQNVRLVNGTTPAEGRLEVFHGESWGTVCDHGWGLDEADVVCRSLGYSSAEVVFYNAYFGEGSGDILLNHVYCTGNESSIFYCSHDGVGVNHCNHYDDVGIRCADGVTTDPAPITTTASTPYWDIWTTSVPFEGEENVTLAVGQPQIIASPNYPWNYPNNVYYNWYITAPSGYDVLVEFLVFDLEWDYDYLLIGTGESRSSPGSVMLAALTGTSHPGYMRLNSSESWMLFTTDSSVTDTGFQLRLSLVYAAEGK
ncbi:deleted in malignant brain tumors 1 protein-like [Lytechinus variegatus]|uniref:deleted in malignant brain tumors 1 protein-like n=1 Tax=Lytechinus variegatus TaxID=7654 RepID=UPI001BB1F460|nr:deleted in malignant brain tumors 1 protein-like [Lytechinus variegatus]